MFITAEEVKRIVSIHFKEKYLLNVGVDDIAWRMKYDDAKLLIVEGIDVGGAEINKVLRILDLKGGEADEEDNH